jgi:hypothetical protein
MVLCFIFGTYKDTSCKHISSNDYIVINHQNQYGLGPFFLHPAIILPIQLSEKEVYHFLKLKKKSLQ